MLLCVEVRELLCRCSVEWGLTVILLGSPGFIGIFDGPRFLAGLESERGIRQGQAAGPFYYVAGTHGALKTVKEHHSPVFLSGFLDDVQVSAETLDEMLKVATLLCKEMVKRGVLTNHEKCAILAYTSDAAQSLVAGVWVKHVQTGEIHKVLGAALAHDDDCDVDGWLLERIKKQRPFFENLINDEQVPKNIRFCILRLSGIPRANFMIQTHPPEECDKAAKWFDGEVMRVVQALIESPLDEIATGILQLPGKMGGCGIRSTHDLAQFASECTDKGEQKMATADYFGLVRAR